MEVVNSTTYLMLVSCLDYSSTLKKEKLSSEPSNDFIGTHGDISEKTKRR
jgi:hypothetical protein